MPYRHLDDNAQAIVRLANDIAHEFELEYVGTEHILLAILRHNQSVAARALGRLNVDEAKARRSIDEIAQRDKEDTWVFGRLPGSPHYKNVVALAIDEAAQLEASNIAPEHLLLGLLREKGSTAQRALAALGVTLPAAKSEVLRQLAGG